MARRADACGADHVHPEVALVADRGLAGVEAHPDLDVNAVRPAVRRKLALGGDRAGHGVPGPLEREEEGVSLRVDLAAARVGQLLAQDPAMLAVHVAVAVSSCSSSRVEPSMSEKRKVTVPPGGVNPAAAGEAFLGGQVRIVVLARLLGRLRFVRRLEQVVGRLGHGASLVRMNRLARGTSPYLLQHADNPVDWYAWGDEAFERARSEDRPILLSIGYSACHWCRVMEHESFEDDGRRLMNERFVNVKVDREERPDVDALYMDAVVALTGHGGWPMTVFLTPEGEPFFGGTYFPPEPRHGMPAFADVLTAVSDLYRERRAAAASSASSSSMRSRRRARCGPRRPADRGHAW